MIEVKATGIFDRSPEVKEITRPGKPVLHLGVGSLNWTVDRGGKPIKMWIDIEAVNDKAWELADLPLNMEITITGTLERAAWQDKETGDWKSKHVVKFLSAEIGAVQTPIQPSPADDDIPF